jgi:hypothetical protein
LKRRRKGLRRIAPYALEGSTRHRHAVLEAIARLATYVRARMPADALFELLGQLHAALPSRHDDRELASKSLALAITAGSHVACDLTLYCRHGQASSSAPTFSGTAFLARRFLQVSERTSASTARARGTRGDRPARHPPSTTQLFGPVPIEPIRVAEDTICPPSLMKLKRACWTRTVDRAARVQRRRARIAGAASGVSVKETVKPPKPTSSQMQSNSAPTSP